MKLFVKGVFVPYFADINRVAQDIVQRPPRERRASVDPPMTVRATFADDANVFDLLCRNAN